MTLRLILTRHAKSGWDDPDLADHDRPLNARGRRAAPAIGQWLRARGHVPTAALLSTARRVSETWDALGLDAEVDTVTRDPRLYLSAPETMLEALADQTANRVILIAHNPGMASLAQWLTRDPPQDDAFERFPTCATLVLDFDGDGWSEIQPLSGRLVDFIVPGALLDGTARNG